MLYKLSGTPTVEVHSENLIQLFVRDANGAPVPNARVRVWAGQPPTGAPAYWTDDFPFRPTSAAGMLEFIVVSGAMPESRDYWMQIIDPSNQPQSDPVQFHFPAGAMIWMTATLTQQGTTSTPPGSTTPINVNLDPRLAPMHVTVANVSVNPGQAYWKIISAIYQDENESGGNHNIYYTVLDQNGITAPGVPILMDWVGRDPNDIPASRSTDGNGTGDQAMYHGATGWQPNAEPGPYTAWVGDPDYRGNKPTGIPGEKLVGCGLPLNRHVNFVVTWKQVIAPTGGGGGTVPIPPPTLEQSVFAAAKKFTWMPINTGAALYRYALTQNLGYPQTDEFEFTYNNAGYIGQVFNLGIVYVKKGDWGNVKWVKKP